jgi:DNA primase
MNRQALDDFKQQIPLLEYLQAHDWRPLRRLRRGRWMGLCPLHEDRKPSLLVDAGRNLFYCYGCGRGGDVIRFVELQQRVRFPEALRLLRQWLGTPALVCEEVAGFYHQQLARHSVAIEYLRQRGIQSDEVVRHMRIGYANGDGLRQWLMQTGHVFADLRAAGLVTADGQDSFSHRITFPLEGNLYGRSISRAADPHRFLPGSKGGLYRWDQVCECDEVILVEGLFDYAVLWQAGFRNVTCSLGSHLNARQFRQLTDRPRTVYLAFDADLNRSGQRASDLLARRLRMQRVTSRVVRLPDGHDPNSLFVAGADVREFRSLMEAAQL